MAHASLIAGCGSVLQTEVIRIGADEITSVTGRDCHVLAGISTVVILGSNINEETVAT